MSSGLPAFMFAQLVSSSDRCSIAHSRISRNALFDRMLPASHLPAEIERRILALMLGMEVRGFVLLVEHPNHDSEENGDDRHNPALYRRRRVGVAGVRSICTER